MADPAYWNRAFSGPYDLETELKGLRTWSLTGDVLEVLDPVLARPGARVLDAGCGAGRWPIELRRRYPNARITGLDFSTAVRAGSARASQDPSPAGGPHFVRGDVGRMPFRDGSFDAILCLGVLGHLEDPSPAVREIVRLLAPGGVCFADVVNATRPYRWRRGWDPLGEFERYESPARLAARFAEAGLRTIDAYAKDPAFTAFTALKPPPAWKATRPMRYAAWWRAAVALRRALAWVPGARGRARAGFYAVAVMRKPATPPAASLPGASIPGLAAVIITKDEERNLPHCLAALAGRVGEIVVLDSGSTDRTREIAERAGARVFVQPFADFSSQKNRAAELATRDWVLNLDADEVLEPSAWPWLERLFREGRQGRFAALSFPRRTTDRDGRFHLWVKHYPAFQDRLYDRRRCRWIGAVHERLSIGGRRGVVPHHMLHREHHFHLSSADYEAKKTLYGTLSKAGAVRAPRVPFPARLAAKCERFRTELGALVGGMHLERRGPDHAAFLARWIAVSLCPPLRRWTSKQRWDERMTEAIRAAESAGEPLRR